MTLVNDIQQLMPTYVREWRPQLGVGGGEQPLPCGRSHAVDGPGFWGGGGYGWGVFRARGEGRLRSGP